MQLLATAILALAAMLGLNAAEHRKDEADTMALGALFWALVILFAYQTYRSF